MLLKIHTVFLQDVECLLAKLQPHVPDIIKNFKEAGSKVNKLGCYGATAYHCWNYIAPQHSDSDATWTIAHQLKKQTRENVEFSFAFTRWKYYLETRENCSW